MAPSSVCLLLMPLFSTQKFLHRSRSVSLLPLRYGTPLSFLPCKCTNRPLSTSSASLIDADASHPKYSNPKSNLSARMSFVFDQIDAIGRDQSCKDEALQRIRSWREQKRKNEASVSESGHAAELGSQLPEKKDNIFATKEIEVVHPWPEWIELMERLLQQNYFDHRRKFEDAMVPDVCVDDVSGLGFVEEGFDFTRDWATVRTACLNFGRDRFDILRSLSKKDIQVLVGHGCPSMDTKVVFSAKLLRKHSHLDEGDVCSSCSLRSSCSRAYLLARKEDEARTLDIMRVLLTFGFDPVIGSVENKPLLKLKSVKMVVRKLLHEVVKLSAVPIDPSLPPPIIKKPPPKIKQAPPPPRKRVGRDDIEMKKGDWLCPKCDFMNFAKNTVCLQCDAKRPKRQLLPGEWECPECNFLNYRRNVVCFHCEHKRPPDEFIENEIQSKPRSPRTRLEKAVNIPEAANAWNFDFDDNESDGADVASFEFADGPRRGKDEPLGDHTTRSSGDFQDDEFENIRTREIQERGRYSASDRMKTPSLVNGTGFDDFNDEDDDIDSYELDIPSSSKRGISRMDSEGGFTGADASSCKTTSRPFQERIPFSDDDVGDGGGNEDFDSDSDSELPVHTNWKSSHIADSRQRSLGGSGISRGLSFGSESDSDDDGLGLNFDSEDEGRGLASKRTKPKKQSFSNRNEHRRQIHGPRDASPFDTQSDDEYGLRSHRSNMKGIRSRSNGRRNGFEGPGRYGPMRDSEFRSNNRMGYGDSGRFKNSGDGRKVQGNAYGGRRANGFGGNLRGDRRTHEQEHGYKHRQRFDSNSERARGLGDVRPRRRIIER